MDTLNEETYRSTFLYSINLFYSQTTSVIVFKFTLLYRYKNNISVFTISYKSQHLHTNRNLSTVQMEVLSLIISWPGLDLTITNAVFIHECDPRASSLGSGPGPGLGTWADASLVFGLSLGSPLAAFKPTEEGWFCLFPEFDVVIQLIIWNIAVLHVAVFRFTFR